ncbi:MAG: murein L,D-transpeptidase [Clostridia bacterium]|nr:murein L,D-transpeptidase [Clostridia bacterium]MBR4442707.1 murein L,D-transpeptidase [Clostridia bacterium]
MEDMVLDMKKTAVWLLTILILLAAMAAGAEETNRTIEETPSETVQAAETAVEEAVELAMYSRGDQVKDLQKRLYALGFLSGSIDGIYGNNTYLAVKEAEEYLRLLEQRRIDEAAEAAMAALTTPAPTAPEGVTAAAAPDETQLPVATPAPTPATVADGVADLALQEILFGEADDLYLCDVSLGGSGLAAKRVQRRLIVLNYLNDAADGVFGVNSQTALAAFQVANELDETGVADRETQKRLFSNEAKAGKKPVYNQLVLGSSGDIVLQVQRQLIILGFMTDSASGVYDKSTQSGVMALEKYLYVIDHPELKPKKTSVPQTTAEIIDSASGVEAMAAADPESNPYEEQPETVSAADSLGFVASGVMSDALQRRFLEDGIPVYSDVLRKGDSGDDVVRLQRRLYTLGYLTKSGVDGLYGSGTESAIKKFQERNRMEQTGISDQVVQYTLFSTDAVKSIKPYQIKVSLSDQKVYVYAPDAYDNYTILKKTFTCSTGTNANPTPKGTFSNTGRGARWHYFKKFDCWAQYAWYIDGDIMFHSVLYDQQDESTLRNASVWALGSKASHGCVRLSVKDAKWIWDNCSSGTTVVVY